MKAFGNRRTRVAFGSAHLMVEGMQEPVARALLEAAVEAGAARLDTAPLYGHGRSEALVAAVVRAHPAVSVTTKVGLEPSPPPARWRSWARAIPPSVRATAKRWLRPGASGAPTNEPSGRFAAVAVRQSIERSLARLGRIDRLLLHEVHPLDIDDELLRVLDAYRQRGDVVSLGIATGNRSTLESLRRSHGLFTVAHVSLDPLGDPVPSFADVPDVQFVGHGALGAGARTLGHLRRRLRDEPSLTAQWAAAVEDTGFDGPDGIAGALLARAALHGPGELVVATSRTGRVAATIAHASGAHLLPPGAARVIDRALSTR